MLRQLCFILVLSICVAVHAQDTELYFPTADEYIAAIPDIIQSTANKYGADSQTVWFLQDDFLFRYGETASPSQLIAAYKALNYGFNSYAVYSPYLKLEGWHQRILERWLELNPLDINEIQSFEFEDYQVSLSPYELDGDNGVEWLWYLHSSEFSVYWLAEEDRTAKSGFRFTSLPIPYQSYDFWLAQYERAGSRFEGAQDMDGDSTVEFIFSSYAALPASWTVATSYSLYVVRWNGTEFQRIFRADVRDDGQEFWTYENLDDDSAIEIVQTVNYFDNLGCSRHSRIVFDLLDGVYSQQGEEDSHFEETVACALRQGEEAMADKQYEHAIFYYRLAGDRFENSEASRQEYFAEMAEYVRERLVIAHIMLNEVDEAETLIRQMNERPQAEGTMAASWIIGIEDGTSAVEICQLAYETIAALEWRVNYRGIPQLGRINEAFYGEIHPYGISSVTQVGCNLSDLAERFAETSNFPVAVSPENTFRDLGFEPRVRSFELNHDGIADWLLWFDGSSFALFFLSQNDSYQVTEAGIREPSEEINLTRVSLPNGDYGLAYVSSFNAEDCRVGYAGDEDESGTRDVSLYTILDGYLRRAFSGSLCFANVNSETVEFDVEINSWGFSLSNIDPQLRHYANLYVWDEPSQTYVQPPLIEATDDASQILSHPLPTVYEISYRLYHDRDYQVTLTLIDDLLLQASEADIQTLHYYRALVLTSLERFDEARTEYHVVVDMDATTVYGLLAALNLR